MNLTHRQYSFTPTNKDGDEIFADVLSIRWELTPSFPLPPAERYDGGGSLTLESTNPVPLQVGEIYNICSPSKSLMQNMMFVRQLEKSSTSFTVSQSPSTSTYETLFQSVPREQYGPFQRKQIVLKQPPNISCLDLEEIGLWNTENCCGACHCEEDGHATVYPDSIGRIWVDGDICHPASCHFDKHPLSRNDWAKVLRTIRAR